MESEKLSLWFELSHASFLTIPRAWMGQMPEEWQDKMADLLNEYDEAFPNMPEGITSHVMIRQGRRFVRMPDWIKNYRRPDVARINAMRGGRWLEDRR